MISTFFVISSDFGAGKLHKNPNVTPKVSGERWKVKGQPKGTKVDFQINPTTFYTKHTLLYQSPTKGRGSRVKGQRSIGYGKVRARPLNLDLRPLVGFLWSNVGGDPRFSTYFTPQKPNHRSYVKIKNQARPLPYPLACDIWPSTFGMTSGVLVEQIHIRSTKTRRSCRRSEDKGQRSNGMPKVMGLDCQNDPST